MRQVNLDKPLEATASGNHLLNRNSGGTISDCWHYGNGKVLANASFVRVRHLNGLSMNN
jgi:hypothetical protein